MYLDNLRWRVKCEQTFDGFKEMYSTVRMCRTSLFRNNISAPHALQRQNTKLSKQIFPEKEYRGLSPNFHIHTSVSVLYIPTIGLPILLEEICIDRSWDYINRSQTHECGNWGWGRAIPIKGIHKWDFRCSVAKTIRRDDWSCNFLFNIFLRPEINTLEKGPGQGNNYTFVL
jgi:hypothetical protein